MMLARAAADFYWMGRYLERAEQMGRLLDHQLTRLVDTPARELAHSWRVLYDVVGLATPSVPHDADEAEAFLIADAYTLAGTLVEDETQPISIVSCWGQARDNAKQLRPWLPVQVWTSLNQGFLWIHETDFPAAWAGGPPSLVRKAIRRLRLIAGVARATMARDDAWRFMELGRHVERLQHQTALLESWDRFGPLSGSSTSVWWADLLRICSAHELYCRVRSMVVRRGSVLAFLIRNPELPRSLRFAVRRIGELLADIDPGGARHPLAPPHAMALHLAAAVEMNPHGDAGIWHGEEESGRGHSFADLLGDSLTLHNLTMAAYVDYPVETGLPS